MDSVPLRGRALLRAFYYDAMPLQKKSRHPVSGQLVNFATTDTARANESLIRDLETREPYAIRMGELRMHGWSLHERAAKEIFSTGRAIVPEDVKPNIRQKGVDIRIGLDVAWISTKRLVETLVLVTGDSDLIPGMKYARREGVRVVLVTLGSNVYRELKVHADYVIDDPVPMPAVDEPEGDAAG